MKKNFYNFILATIIIFGLDPQQMLGQCVSSNNNPSGTINVSTVVQTIVSMGMNSNDYAVINITTAGEYQVNTSFGTSLNVTDNSNVSIASGSNPLNVSFPTTGLYRIHVCASNGGPSRIVAISPKNRGFNFDGVNDVIEIGTSLTNAIGTSSVLTAEAWVRPTANASSGGNIVSNHNLNTSFCLRRTGNTYSAFVGFGAHAVATAANTATLNVWQHVAMVFDGTSLSIFINGNLAGTSAFAPYTLPINSVGSATVQIGNNGFGEAFEGDIDEVRVWKRAVCQGEIQKNMNGVFATIGNQLLANYHFEQGVIGGNNTSVTSLIDLSGNNFNGTVMNAALTGTISNWAVSAAYPANVSSPLVDVAPAFTSPVISVSGASSICNGASTTLTASGGVTTFNWLSGPTTATNNVSPTTTTTYSVTGTNLGCMSNTATITLTVNATPTISVNSGSICSGSSFTMVPSGAITYTFSSGSAVVSPTTNATYTLTGTGTNGCINSTSSNVTVNVCSSGAALNFDGFDDLVNLGTAITNSLSGATKITAEAWVNPSNLSGVATIHGNHNTTGNNMMQYLLRRNSSGWEFYIGNGSGGAYTGLSTAPNTATVGVWQHVAGTWDGAVARIYVNGVLSATTSITYASMGTFSNPVWIGRVSPTSESWNGDIDEVRIWNRVLCQGEIQNNMLGQITLPQTNLLAYYQFNQGVAASTNTSVTSLIPLAGPTGTLQNVVLTSGTTSNWVSPGGVVSGNTVMAFVSPTIAIAGASVICSGTSTTFTASGANSYTWLGGPTTSTFAVTPTVTTTYSVVGIASNGCVSNMATQTINVNALPTISVNSGVICAGQSFTMVPTGADIYMYSNGTDVVMPTADATYSVSGIDANGCVSNVDAVSSVTVNPLPVIVSESGNVTVCGDATGTFSVNATNTVQYDWGYSNGGSTTMIDGSYGETGYSTTVMQIPTLQTEGWNGYDITCLLTSADGCTVTCSPKSITINQLPSITINSGVICAGQSFTMVASGADTYTYSSGTDIVMPNADATYTVIGTETLTGCTNSVESSVTVNALPTVMATTNNTLLCTGETATLSVTGADTYTWSTIENTANIVVSPTTQTTFTVDGTDVNGCSNATTITQDVSLCTGIAALTNNSTSITIYPNPNNGLFVLELTTLSKVTVTNSLGQFVLAETFEAGKHSLDIQNEARGVYFVKVIENNKQQTIKVVKQ